MKYAQARLREWHEKEAIEFMERNRKQTHFENINRTCNQTVVSLSASLLEIVYQIIDTDDTIDKLKLSPDNKLEMWGQLKVWSKSQLSSVFVILLLQNQVFTKAGCIIYSLVILVITLKLQLNIVGSYLYKDPNSVPADVQEKYLSLCKAFLKSGVAKIADVVKVEVGDWF